jgi:hypothetical protein
MQQVDGIPAGRQHPSPGSPPARPRRAAPAGTRPRCPAPPTPAGRRAARGRGWGPAANQPSIAGSSCRWISVRRRDAGRERLDVSQCRRGVVEAERPQPRLRLLRREPNLPRTGSARPPPAPGSRRSAVAAAAPCGWTPARRPPERRGPSNCTGCAPAAAGSGLVRGHQVRAAQVIQLDPVLQHALQRVGLLAISRPSARPT